MDIRKYTATKIREYRKKAELTQKELGEKIGVKHNTVSGYENGTNEPEQDILFKIASALNISINDLFPNTTSIPKEGFIPNYKKVPLLGTTAAGEPIYSEEHFEEYIDVHEKYKVDYCLRVQGDSMIGAHIYDGDIVFVRKQSTVENGEIAVVRIGDSVTLKRFYKTDTGVMLQSENPKYPPMIFNIDNTESFIILGKAIILQTTIK